MKLNPKARDPLSKLDSWICSVLLEGEIKNFSDSTPKKQQSSQKMGGHE